MIIHLHNHCLHVCVGVLVPMLPVTQKTTNLVDFGTFTSLCKNARSIH